MTFHDRLAQYAINEFNSNATVGLTLKNVEKNAVKFGSNAITERKKRNIFSRIFDAIKEPMLIILLFGLALTFGTNLGKFLKTGYGDFSECIGITFAIILSVSITVIMEGSSEKAFKALQKIYDNLTVKVIREGVVVSIPHSHVVVGDILLLESGDKIVADGRLLDSVSLCVDESALTGESNAITKNANTILPTNTPLAERVNCVYSGTFVTDGGGKMIVTATGDKTEMGVIAGGLNDAHGQSPLQQKLTKLGKVVTIIGAITATIVFLISAIRLALLGCLDFSSVQELFISSIVLIIAAVPEGLPTVVAVSLALNMLKLAKENALIKKMTATETAGAVSVICSDKTGTLTTNKMTVVGVCKNKFCSSPDKIKDEVLFQNFVCNSTADVTFNHKKEIFHGNATECALLKAYCQSNPKVKYSDYRKNYQVVDRQPFSSEKKYMTTTINLGKSYRKLIKGAPEIILKECSLNFAQLKKVNEEIKSHQKKARRVICFAHADFEKDFDGRYVFDGFATITDPIRKDIIKAVSDCRRAGIKIKILTGDNIETAFAIAKELNVANSESQVLTAKEVEEMDDQKLKKLLPSVTVIARSTPSVKLRVVKILKSLGEVVAVTGDGINDAPAIKQADVGIAMGINGSDITKEAADVVLVDDSFSTIVKAISFGRNVYKNLQRFILFQLSVNLSALLFVTACAIFGYETPFNTLQLLWINIIMDGPPALTLGLERASDDLMDRPPVKRNAGIVGKGMVLRIIFNAVFIGAVMIAEYFTDFLQVGASQMKGAIFTLFIMFQLFNAFNSRELGSKSIFVGIGRNKIMVFTFACVFLLHFIMVQYLPLLFGVTPLSLSVWLKTLLVACTIIVVSELGKFVYGLYKSVVVKAK